jgi:MerR family transcriptional regulator/heat shock protein HspR
MSTQMETPRLWRLELAAERVRLPVGRVRRYVRAGLVRPAHGEGAEALFGESELKRLRKIRRLRDDLGINSAGLEVVLRLLDEIEVLQAARTRHERRSDRP